MKHKYVDLVGMAPISDLRTLTSRLEGWIVPTSSRAVNRVLGGDPSLIFGSLLANGRVFLLNPNGVLFGSGSTVNVGGLLAATLSLQSYGLTTGKFSLAQDPTKALAAVVNKAYSAPPTMALSCLPPRVW